MVNMDKSLGTNELEQRNNYFEFNINHSIAVELTDYGKKIIRDKEISFLRRSPTLSRIDGDVREKYTNGGVFNVERYVEEEIMPKYNGLCEFQLWDFMNKFGAEVYMGGKTLFVENKIYFKENEENKDFGYGANRVSEEMAENLMNVLKQ